MTSVIPVWCSTHWAIWSLIRSRSGVSSIYTCCMKVSFTSILYPRFTHMIFIISTSRVYKVRTTMVNWFWWHSVYILMFLPTSFVSTVTCHRFPFHFSPLCQWHFFCKYAMKWGGKRNYFIPNNVTWYQCYAKEYIQVLLE